MAKKKTEDPEHGFPTIELRDDGIRSYLDACLANVIPPLLFTGPEGVGKEHAAIDFARQICCTEVRTCRLGDELCESCRQAVAFEHPGIHVVYPTPTQGTGEKPGDDAADILKVLEVKRGDFFDTHRFTKKVSIRIARSRAIIQRANTKPFGAAYNVFVVAQADTMREEAQNALLKVLEEPPAHCVMILITDNPDAILYTIRSRCQRVRFSPLTTQTVEAVLTDYYGAAPALARKAADLAQGSIRRGRELIDEQDEEGRAQALDILTGLPSANEAWVVQNALGLTRGKSRDNVARFLHEFATVYRDIMVSDEALFINRDQSKMLTKQAGKWDRRKLPEVLDRILTTRDEVLRRNLNMDAALVDLFLDIRQLGC